MKTLAILIKVARFKDRVSAAGQLLPKLGKYKDDLNAVVVGLPRGGMITASEIAKGLNLPLGFLIVKKVGAPGDPELALGAVTDDGGSYLDEEIIASMNIPETYLDEEIEKKREEARHRSEEYLAHFNNPAFADKTIILTDDGIATGATMRAAIKSLVSRGARKVVIAVPAGPCEHFGKIRSEADEIICLGEDYEMNSVGDYYDEFPEVTDGEVIEILKHAKNITN